MPSQGQRGRKEKASATQPIIGYALIVYVFFTLALTIVLSHYATTPQKLKARQQTVLGQITHVKARKEAFIKFLLPSIQYENHRMQDAQRQLKTMAQRAERSSGLSRKERQQLTAWAQKYDVDTGNHPADFIKALALKMDEIPASMVLAQGAMESAWGTSRFARQANNYFGQWCFTKGCGLVPKHRAAGATHEVQTFSGINEAVAAYFVNINRHGAYQRVRDERTLLRQSDEPLDSLKMVRGLEKYSARGEAYVEELQGMIRFNKFKQFD